MAMGKKLGLALRSARKNKGLTLVDAGIALGLSHAAIQQWEKGTTSPTIDNLTRFCEAVGADLSELRNLWLEEQTNASDNVKLNRGDSDARPATRMKPLPEFFGARDLPVYASAEGGDGELIVSSDPVAYEIRPHTLHGIKEAYAIVVRGESMVPAYRPGDQAWANPRMPWQEVEADVILYAVDDGMGEARAMIKEVVKWDATTITLRQYNPPKVFQVQRSEWNRIHRVTGKFNRM